jgi:hypothetical protein
MKDLAKKMICSCLPLAITSVFASTSFGAETHVIVGAKQQVAWTYKDKKSTPTTPLVVDDLQVGDIIEVQVPGPFSHGFITIKTSAGGAPTEIKDPVLACGEAASSKPNAVLRETDCGATSQFGKDLNNATVRLEVLATFKSDIDFWCTVHKGGMTGTLKLKK